MSIAKLKIVASLLAVAMLTGGAFAGECGNDEKLDVKPVLAPDPEVLKIIESLGEGCSALLPRFKVTGDLNAVAKRLKLDKTGPCARDYCIKMVWMPDRKRAIYCGANHWYPHRLNDVWEYDLPGNTWVCLYGPDKNKKTNRSDWDDVAVDENGIFRTKRGGPASIGHTWWQLTYDSEKKAVMWLCAWGPDPAFSKTLRGKMGAKPHWPPLWLFYPYDRKWEPVVGSKFEGRKPKYINASALEYIPDIKATVWTTVGGMWSYDSKGNTWTDLKPNDGGLKHRDPRSHAYEAVMAYLPSRKILVSAGFSRTKTGAVGRTNVYSFKTNTWKKVAEGKDVPMGYDSKTPFAYDSVADVCLMCDKDKQLWAFDVDKAEWSKIIPKGPPPTGHLKSMSYYDPQRNVWVIHRSGKVWVYRHKRRVPGALNREAHVSGVDSKRR